MPTILPKKKGKDAHEQERLEYRPCHSDSRLLVAHLKVAPDQKVEQLVVAHELAQAYPRPPACARG